MLTLLLAFIAVRVMRAVVSLLVSFGGASPSDPTTVVSAVESDSLHPFWLRRVSLIAGFLLFGWAVVSLMPSLGFSIDVARLVALLCGLGMLAVAIEIVWRRPGQKHRPQPIAPHALSDRALAGLGGGAPRRAVAQPCMLYSHCRRRCVASATSRKPSRAGSSRAAPSPSC